MARMPDASMLQGRTPRAARGRPNYSANPIGAALQNLGGELAQFGAQGMAQKASAVDQDQKFGAQSRFLQFEQSTRQSAVERARQMAPGGAGFTEGLKQDYVAAADKFWSSIPPELQAEYGPRLLNLEGDLTAKATTLEQEAHDIYALQNIEQGQGVLLNRQAANPASWADVTAEGEEHIRNAGLPPITAEEEVRKWRERRALQLFQTDQVLDAAGARSKLGVAATGGGGGFVDRVVGVESGGNATAKNPRSSATGAGQFIESTWASFIRDRHPELIAQGDIQKHRNDPTLSREAVQWYADQNAAVLEGAGLPVTDGTLYLAHFAGPAGAKALLQADPAATAEDVLGAGVVSANPFLRGKSAADVIAWADKKMGGAGVRSRPDTSLLTDPAPEYADLPYETRRKLFEESLAAETRAAEEAAAAAKAQAALDYAAHKDGYELGIVQGEILDETAILNDPLLKDGDKASLIKSFRTQHEKTLQLQLDATEFEAGTLSLNPVDTADRARANNLYADLVKRVPAEAAPVLTGAFIEQTGVVPTVVAAQIRNGLSSDDPEQLASSLADAANIYERAPSAIDHMDGGAEIRDAGAAFRHLVNERGLSAPEAAQRIIEMRSPEAKRMETALKPAADKFVKDLRPADVTATFDPGYLTSEPEPAFNPALTETMMADYREIAREKFIGDARGDPGVAKAMAVAEMKRLYGVTTVNGTATLMKYPPENFYPAIAGSHDYLQEAAKQDAATAADGKEVLDIYIAATPQTADDIRQGRLPRYRFYFAVEENGQSIWHEYLDGGFGFTPEQLRTLQEGKRGAARSENLLQREQDRAVAESLQGQREAMQGDVPEDDAEALRELYGAPERLGAD